MQKNIFKKLEKRYWRVLFMSKKKRTQINSAYDILEQVEKIKGKNLLLNGNTSKNNRIYYVDISDNLSRNCWI